MCCCGCVIFSDLMNAAAGSLNGSWTVGAGTFGYNGLGQAMATTPAARDYAYVAPIEIQNPLVWLIGHAVAAEVKVENDDDEAGIVIGTDGNTIIYVILKAHSTAATVTVYKWDGVSESVTATASVTAAPGAFHKLRACQTNVNDIWVVYLNDDLVLHLSSANIVGDVADKRAGGMIARNTTSNPQWKWLTIKKADTSRCPCSPCTQKDTIDTFAIDAPLYNHGTGAGVGFQINGSERLENTLPEGNPRTAATFRCAMTPPGDLDFSLAADVWAPTGGSGGRNAGVALELDGLLASGSGSIKWVARDDAATFRYTYTDNTATTATNTVAQAPVAGDTLMIRVTATGPGTYDLDFLVNGVSLHTANSVPLTFARTFYYGVTCTVSFSAGEAQFDNVTYDKEV